MDKDERVFINKQINKDNSEAKTIKKEIKTSNGKEDIDVINIKTEIKQPPSLLTDLKKTVGLDQYSDTSFILYILLFFFGVQKINELLSFIKNLLTLPKKVEETYNFITKEDIKLLDKLDDLMNQLLGITGADRIAIAKIHNGTYDNTGSHQMKFSIVYEVVSVRAKTTKNEVQDVPINFIKEEISQGSTRYFQRVERSNLNSLCDLYLDKIGIQCKDYKLLSFNKQIYGIIDIHWIVIPEVNYFEDAYTRNRFNTVIASLEDTLQSILLKTNWLQNFIRSTKRFPSKTSKFISNIFKK